MARGTIRIARMQVKRDTKSVGDVSEAKLIGFFVQEGYLV